METKSAPRAEASAEKQSSLFQAIMTPIHFISFLLSLYLIDCHYHDKRIQEHSDRYSRLPSWVMPGWLDRLLSRPHPYGWVDREKRETPDTGGNRHRWYYHTKQKKLMKMEAADAFELQRSVVLGLGVVVLCAAWATYRLSAGLLAWYAS
ncbi:hypothetical protein M426DRAFT_106418 [Hypoxylon sp. CI-4A]|nr:hypothetical protein M426DRAFT_106418 [Hypoxylon sp. CI-4A]